MKTPIPRSLARGYYISPADDVMEQAMPERPIWKPGQALIEQANVTAFARQAIRRWGLALNTYPDFYAWSADHPAQFWDSVWDSCGVIASNKGRRVLVDGARMPLFEAITPHESHTESQNCAG